MNKVIPAALITAIVVAAATFLLSQSIFMNKIEAERDSFDQLFESKKEEFMAEISCEEPEPCEYEGLVLPYVYIPGKAYANTTQLTLIQSQITEPITAYYKTEGQQVITIEVRNLDLEYKIFDSFMVTFFTSNLDGLPGGGYSSFIHSIDKNGNLPAWEPDVN